MRPSAATIRSQAGARPPITVLMAVSPPSPTAAQTARSGREMQWSDGKAAALSLVEGNGLDADLAGGAAGVDHQQVVPHQAGAVREQPQIAAPRRGLPGHGVAEAPKLVP